MNDLCDIEREPAFLEKIGFVRQDCESSDTVRMVWYERTIDSSESQVRFIVQVEFELTIGDDPSCPSIDNYSYSFNRVYLKVIDRKMRRLDNQFYDDETESPRKIGRVEVNIRTLNHLRMLCKMLSWKD